MNPTLGNRFCNPDISAREVVVFPTCCFVAATKIGFWEKKRHAVDDLAAAALPPFAADESESTSDPLCILSFFMGEGGAQCSEECSGSGRYIMVPRFGFFSLKMKCQ